MRKFSIVRFLLDLNTKKMYLADIVDLGSSFIIN